MKYLDGEDTIDVVFKKVHEFKSDNARVAMAGEGDLPSLAKKKVSFRDMSGMIRNAFDALWDEREKKMGIEQLLNATYDNADPHAAAPVVAAAPQPLGGVALGGAARGRAVDWKPPKREPADRAGPVPFDYAAAVGDPWRPLKREPKAEARAAAPAVIDLRGDSDVEMVAAPAPAQQAPIEIDSDAAPSPIAVDADGEPWTCARCTYADNRPCFLCCEMCGGERAS